MKIAPSESAISDAIDRLSAGAFQRLAEHYAQVRYPERFRHLIPLGRTVTDQTRSGWSDGCVYLADGRVDAVEATKDQKWKRHLNDDLEHISQLGRGTVAGFVFVCAAPTPKSADLRGYYDQLRGLGLPSAQVALVFRDELVRTLTEPAYAEICRLLLDLPSGVHPFVPLDRAPVFGGGSLSQFVPTREEYETGAVHRPAIAAEVEARLGNDRWAFVRGRGAAGKTVLAVQIGLDRAPDSPVYYLDLAATGGKAGAMDTQAALDVMVSRSASNVLFIVDNVHRDELTAQALFDFWETAPGESSLLLLGRWTQKGASHLGLAESLEDLNRDAVVLSVSPADLLGVFLRLTRRAGLDVSADSLSGELVAKWKKTFAGDLVAFSFAVSTKLRRSTPMRDWALEAADARDYVREQYLASLTTAERMAMERLATLATLEIPASSAVIDPGAVAPLLSEGSVLRIDGDGPVPLYQLVHAGIGQLLIDALGIEAEVDERLVAIASEDPSTGLQIAARLEAERRKELAARALEVALDDEGDLVQTVAGGGVQAIGEEVGLAIRVGARRPKEIDDALAPRMEVIGPGLLAGSPKGLLDFLRVAQRYLAKTQEALIKIMDEPAHVERLQQTFANPSVDFRTTTALLMRTEGRLASYPALIAAATAPDALRIRILALLRLRPRVLVRELVKIREVPRYGEAISETLSFGICAQWFRRYVVRHADSSLPVLLHYGRVDDPRIGRLIDKTISSDGLVEELFRRFRFGKIANVGTLTKALDEYLPTFRTDLVAQFDAPEFAQDAVEARLEHSGAPLTHLIKQTWGSFPELTNRVFEELLRPELRDPLADCVLGQPIESAVRLIAAVKHRDPRVARTLFERLTSPACESRLLARLTQASPSDVRRLLELADVPLLEWMLNRGGIEAFLSSEEEVRLLPMLGRALKEPSRAGARAAVSHRLFDRDSIEDWRPSLISVDHLASALIIGRDRPVDERLQWLTCLFETRKWKDARVQWSRSRWIATPLFNIWLTQETPVVEAVSARLDTERFSTAIERQVVEALNPPHAIARLIGVARLFGLSLGEASYLNEDWLEAAVRAAHRRSRAWMTHAQAETWLGVRVIAERIPGAAVPKGEAAVALDLLRRTGHQTSRELLFQRYMSEWLEQVCDARGRLPADQPVAGALIDPSLEGDVSRAGVLGG